ncbi:alpha-tocopherol transfer protein-like [Styela clava]|uniref:alpha-tocopherol transfer protein-like n=1 Tax=Styela clava TaxID=7725 RepID=UPI0019399885|nr:alpha-tocopherol transfer protein-like [Styela clava]
MLSNSRRIIYLLRGNYKMISERYQCQLSSAALKKAVEELNEPEDNEVRLAAIDKLRTRFQEEIKDFELIRTDDSFLLRFLRHRKFNEDKALKSLENYHRHRKTWKSVFNLVDNPEKIDEFLSVGSVVPLKERAKDGTFVNIGRPGFNFGKKDGILQFMAATILSTEKLLENEEMQIYGVTVIEELKDFGIGLSLQMTTVGMQFMNLMQDGMPIRIKSLNVFNESLAYDLIYACVRPFIKEKLRNRLQLHGNSHEKLHEMIDPENLPPFLGGSGPELDIEWWKEQLLQTNNNAEK